MSRAFLKYTKIYLKWPRSWCLAPQRCEAVSLHTEVRILHRKRGKIVCWNRVLYEYFYSIYLPYIKSNIPISLTISNHQVIFLINWTVINLRKIVRIHGLWQNYVFSCSGTIHRSINIHICINLLIDWYIRKKKIKTIKSG